MKLTTILAFVALAADNRPGLLVFNPIPKNTKPMEQYQPMIHDVIFA